MHGTCTCSYDCLIAVIVHYDQWHAVEQKLCKLVTTVGLFKTIVLFFIGFSYGELTLSYLAITSNFAWFAHTHTHIEKQPVCMWLASQWRIQDFEKRGSVPIPRSRRQCIEVCSADPSVRSAEKNFRLHFSLIRMGSHGTLMLALQVPDVAN